MVYNVKISSTYCSFQTFQCKIRQESPIKIWGRQLTINSVPPQFPSCYSFPAALIFTFISWFFISANPQSWGFWALYQLASWRPQDSVWNLLLGSIGCNPGQQTQRLHPQSLEHPLLLLSSFTFQGLQRSLVASPGLCVPPSSSVKQHLMRMRQKLNQHIGPPPSLCRNKIGVAGTVLSGLLLSCPWAASASVTASHCKSQH